MTNMSKHGYHVTVNLTAYIMADTPEEAKARVASGLRRQHSVLVTSITPLTAIDSDIVPDDYVESDVWDQALATESQANITSKPKAKRRRLCPVHKANLHDQQPCSKSFIGCAVQRLREEA